MWFYDALGHKWELAGTHDPLDPLQITNIHVRETLIGKCYKLLTDSPTSVDPTQSFYHHFSLLSCTFSENSPLSFSLPKTNPKHTQSSENNGLITPETWASTARQHRSQAQRCGLRRLSSRQCLWGRLWRSRKCLSSRSISYGHQLLWHLSVCNSTYASIVFWICWKGKGFKVYVFIICNTLIRNCLV